MLGKSDPTKSTVGDDEPSGFWKLWRSSPGGVSGVGGGDKPTSTSDNHENFFQTLRCALSKSETDTPISAVVATRPINLPEKNEQEIKKHLKEFEKMRKSFRKKEEQEAKEKQRRETERLAREDRIRVGKHRWLNHTLPNWTKLKTRRRTRELVWEGVPPSIRNKVWPIILGNDLHITPELYSILLSQREKRDVGGEGMAGSGLARQQIVLDLPRTFPVLSFFQEGGPLKPHLKQVLEAYALYRPDIGYVQGMSYLGAMLLLYLDAYDAFMCLANILNKPLAMCFYKLGMTEISKYIGVLNILMEECIPGVYHHLKELDITPELYIVDWYLTIFCKALPLEVAGRIWDVYFYEGEEFLLRSALGILSMFADTLSTKSFDECLHLLTHLPKDMNENALMNAISSLKVNKGRIQELLNIHCSA